MTNIIKANWNEIDKLGMAYNVGTLKIHIRDFKSSGLIKRLMRHLGWWPVADRC